MARTFGSSDVPVVLGVSPYRNRSEFQLWSRLCGFPVEPSEDDGSMARGRMIEPGALKRLGQELGIRIRPNDVRWTLAAWESGHTTPDGIAWWKSQMTGCAEVKAFDDDKGWGEPGSSDVRIDVAVQCMWHMAGTETPVCHVGLAYGWRMNGWAIYRMERDLAREARLVARCRTWWNDHVGALVPPLVDDSEATAKAIALVYGAVTNERVEIEATPADRQLLAMLRAIDEQLAPLQEARKAGRNVLRLRLAKAKATHLVSQGRTLASWTTTNGTSRLLVRKKEKQ